MSLIGKQLLQPEAGWRRYDDTDVNIHIGENADRYNYSTAYQKSVIRLNSIGAYAKFNFTGDRIRIIGTRNTEYFKRTTIIIDGVRHEYSSRGYLLWQCLLFEKVGLHQGEHYVEIIRETPYTGNIQSHVDAIDIEERGELSPYRKVMPKYLFQCNNNILKPTMNGLELVEGTLNAQLFEEHGTDYLPDIIGRYDKEVDMVYKEDLEDKKLYGYKLVGYRNIDKLEVK